MDVHAWLSASGPGHPLLIDPGVACSLRSHSPLATFWPRLRRYLYPPSEHYLLAASVGATSTRPASTTFRPRLRRYLYPPSEHYLLAAPSALRLGN